MLFVTPPEGASVGGGVAITIEVGVSGSAAIAEEVGPSCGLRPVKDVADGLVAVVSIDGNGD